MTASDDHEDDWSNTAMDVKGMATLASRGRWGGVLVLSVLSAVVVSVGVVCGGLFS